MPKLLLIASEFPPGPGGIGTHAYQLSHHLTQLGWQVTVLSAQEHTSSEQIAKFNAGLNIDLYTVSGQGLRKALNYLHRFREIKAKWKPDLILASGLRPLWYASMQHDHWAAVLHGRELRFGGVVQRQITHHALEKAASVISVSKHTQQQMINLGITPHAIQVIHNGGDADTFKPTSCHPERPTLLTVGNISLRKGQDIVISALPAIIQAIPDVKYQLAGAVLEAERLTSLAQQLGVWDRVELLGTVPLEQLATLYNCCTVFVMTSRDTHDDFEGYGIAAVEAAFCGKPAIVSGGSGLQEAVADGLTGLVVPQNDPQALATAVIDLLRNPDKLRRMGQAAYQRAHAEQTWEICAAKYHKVLCSLTNL